MLFPEDTKPSRRVRAYHVNDRAQHRTSLKTADYTAGRVIAGVAEVLGEGVERDGARNDTTVVAEEKTTYSQEDCRGNGDGSARNHDFSVRIEFRWISRDSESDMDTRWRCYIFIFDALVSVSPAVVPYLYDFGRV